jgi:hypothetical protein
MKEKQELKEETLLLKIALSLLLLQSLNKSRL